MKNVSIPDELANRVEAAGVDLVSYAIEAIEQKLTREKEVSPKSLAELKAKGWKPPTVKGKARKDGHGWSEIEAATDAA